MFLLLFSMFAQAKLLDINCDFPKKNLQFQLKNYQNSFKVGSDPSRYVTVTDAGVVSKVKSEHGFSSGRSSGITGDTNNRPSWSLNIENGNRAYRLIIYYCDAKNNVYQAEAAINPKMPKSGDDFEGPAISGTCISDGLQNEATIDCSSFR